MAGLKGKALYDFQGDASLNELSFAAGEEILVLRQDVGEGWWEGQIGQKIGLFPQTYVEMVADAGNDSWDEAEEQEPEEDWEEGGHGADSDGDAEESHTDSASAGAFANYTPGATIGKAGTLRRSVNRFSGFVKAGGESFMLGGLKDIVVDPARMIHITHAADGLVWTPNPKPYGVIVVEHAGTRKKFRGFKEFEAYTIGGASANGSVERRHKHFVWLYERLREKYSCLCIPPLPDKQFMSKYGEELILKRQQKLQQWLRRLARHPVISRDELSLHHFLCFPTSDEKGWKNGKREAEKDAFVGGQFFKLISQDVPCPKSAEKDIEVFATFLKNVAAAVKKNQDTALSHANRMFSGFRKEYKSIADSFNTLGETEGSQGGGDSTKLGMALVKCSKTFDTIGDMWASQPKKDQLPLYDTLKEYLGLVNQFGDGLSSCRAANEKVAEIHAAENADEKEKKLVQARRDVLHSLVLCEAAHFHKQRREDFRDMMKAYLQAQITFHEEIAEHLKQAKAEFDRLNF
eukprot:m.227291 g.227291  ORF g.227291 m.227291 type:complete len:519 (-) comp17180_c0_seq1:227-1783(-)